MISWWQQYSSLREKCSKGQVAFQLLPVSEERTDVCVKIMEHRTLLLPSINPSQMDSLSPIRDQTRLSQKQRLFLMPLVTSSLL